MKSSRFLLVGLIVLLAMAALACSLVGDDTTPAVTDEVPAVTEEVPAVTEEAPVVTEETPAATEEAPVVTEETPAATEETSVVTEETPAATEETPAATTEVPALQGQFLEQWAVTATASSEYGNPDWAAIQAIGAPNTQECGDFVTAWASSTSSSPYEWLELRYAIPVFPDQIRIYETYSPGSIIRVEVITPVSDYIAVWEDGPRTDEDCPHVLTIPVEGIEERVFGVRITLDQSIIQSWNEIDAVQLVGRAFE
ncbi:MAG: hypothetical protein JW892_06135 [Anaerolineae bacterium]|nr:hypothetical protein [Anaerolineae bacterium]